MSHERSNGGPRRENSVLFALDELTRIEQERVRRDEADRSRREADRRSREEDDARRAAARAALDIEMIAVVAHARAEAEARVAVELATLRAEIIAGASPVGPSLTAAPAARSRVPMPLRVVAGSVAVAAFSLVAALVFVPREIIVRETPARVTTRTVVVDVPVVRTAAPPETTTAVVSSEPATGKVKHHHTARPAPATASTTAHCDKRDPLCGLGEDIGTAH